MPLAPGTAGSLLALGIHWQVLRGLPPLAWLPILVGLFAMGVYAAGLAEQDWGRDAPKVVIDEIVGCLVAMLWMPKDIWVLSISFLAFRVFDILKPFPAHRSQRLPGGWGTMVDDLVAGVYANGAVRLMLWLC